MATPETTEKVLEMRKAGKSFKEIATAAGISESLTKYLWYSNKPKGNFLKNKISTDNMHYLTPEEIKTVKMMYGRGLNAREIAEKTGLSVYNIYKAKKESGVPIRRYAKGRSPRVQALDERVIQLKNEGLTLVEIAKKLKIPKGTVSTAYYRFKKNNNFKGELQQNGHNAHVSNGNGTPKGWTKENLVGAFASEVIKLSEAYANTHNYQRVGLSAETLRRRITELLAS